MWSTTTSFLFVLFIVSAAGVKSTDNENQIDKEDMSRTAALEFPHNNFTSGISRKIPVKSIDATNTVPKKYKPAQTPVESDNDTRASYEFPAVPIGIDTPQTNEGKIKYVSYNVSTELPTAKTNVTTNVTLLMKDDFIYTPASEAKDLLLIPNKHTSKYNESEEVPAKIDKVFDSFTGAPINNEVEEIENGENTEDNRVKHTIETAYERSSANGPLVHGQLAAILAGFFVIISIIAYLGLLYWRRYLENRYGSRQMLVDDEFYDPTDMRNFSI